MSEEFPRVMVARGAKKPGNRHFGPYSHAWAIRQTLQLLLKVFPVRSCRAGVFRQHQLLGRPCLLGQIDRCSAPCVGRVTPAAHRQIANDFCDFMAGKAKGLLASLQSSMKTASIKEDYETAARLRDNISAVEAALDVSAVVLSDGTNADVVAAASDELEALVEVFHVRDGRVRGERRFTMERIEDISDSSLMQKALVAIYDEASGEEIPAEILVSGLPAEIQTTSDWLSTKGAREVKIRQPKTGPKSQLLLTVVRNAQHGLAFHKLRRGGDLTTRAQAMNELGEALNLPEPPFRIETIDISNAADADIVASLVVFEDGLPKKSDYRRFIIKSVDRQDDFASVAEVCRRRFAATTKREGFAKPPSLVVIDGGLGQVNAASAAMKEVGSAQVPVVGLAKRLEEIYLPGLSQPISLPRNSQGLFLLQRMRDEAHRFANSHLQQRRKKRLLASELDSITGLGETKKRDLLAHFGSLAKVRESSVEQLCEVSGIGPALAQQIHSHFHQRAH
jgi:excinuclease ABC subunit C